MNPYRHIAISTREYHEGLMAWCRRLLSDAGMESLEVYGQIPAKGLTTSHLVFFPYRLGPEPKVVESAPGTSLLRPRVPLPANHPFVPEVWLALGAAVVEAVEATFPNPRYKDHPRNHPESNGVYPPVSALPASLRAWYQEAEAAAGEPWTVPGPAGPLARPPALGWRQGLGTMVRYIVLAHEPGRGTDERTSASPPVALSALNVILGAVHRERTVDVLVPPQPVPDGLMSYAEALAGASDEPIAGRIRAALAEIQAPLLEQISLVPINDLNNREMIALMQSMQRPLQASLNLQMRYVLGSTAVFGPSSFVSLGPKGSGLRPPAARGEDPGRS